MPSTTESVGQGSERPVDRVIVFDDSGAAHGIVGVLRAKGLWVNDAGPSVNAADVLNQERPDLIVQVDSNPRAPGGEVAAVRAKAAALGIPVLVVIDNVTDMQAHADADDVVTRSALEKELPARAARLLERRKSARGTAAASDSSRPGAGSVLPADTSFFALVVHDLRTPLNVIGLSLRMISQAIPRGDEELEEDLRFVEENFRQIERMLSQLSDFYRLFETGSTTVETEFNPKRLVDELLEARTTKPGTKFGPVRVEAQDCPDEVSLDPARARLAIQYVLTNTTAASNGEPIDLTMRGGPDRWVIEVKLNVPAPGSVKPVTLSPTSFERLCGFAAERRGMDLAIAAKISELFGGSARLELAEDRATTVVLDWPARLNSA